MPPCRPVFPVLGQLWGVGGRAPCPTCNLKRFRFQYDGKVVYLSPGDFFDLAQSLLVAMQRNPSKPLRIEFWPDDEDDDLSWMWLLDTADGARPVYDQLTRNQG